MPNELVRALRLGVEKGRVMRRNKAGLFAGSGNVK
jgi:hypothetical protein